MGSSNGELELATLLPFAEKGHQRRVGGVLVKSASATATNVAANRNRREK